MQNALKQFEEKDTALLSGQFSRARLELTIVYAVILAIILGISSIIIYSFFSHRLDLRMAQRHILVPPPLYVIDPDLTFPDAARSDLAVSLFLVNGILFAGAIGLSYILAGITLQPIQNAYNKQKQFLSDASHELRTPLAILQTDLENELADAKQGSEAHQQIESHLEEVGRMGAIVKDLLLISRLDTETKQTKTEDVSLTTVAQDATERLMPYAKKRNIHLSFTENSLENDIVRANTEHILQALTNLIKNGIDYNNEHGTVVVAVEKTKDQAVVTVTDVGVGIPKKELDHVFDRFYRVEKSRTRQTGGSGLGLSIVQSIAHTYRGTITLSNNSPTGIIARLSFPIKEAS